MRTNIEINDDLMKQAAKAVAKTGATTKRAIVEAGLRMLVQTHKQTSIRKLRGKVEWEGNLDESRRNRFEDWG